MTVLDAELFETYKKCSPSTRLENGTCFKRNELLCLLDSAAHYLGIPVKHKVVDGMSNVEILHAFGELMDANVRITNHWLEDPKLMQAIYKSCPLLAKTILYDRLVPSYSDHNGSGWTNNRQLTRIADQFVRALDKSSHRFVFAGAYNNTPSETICGLENKCKSPMLTHFSKSPTIPWSIILNTSYEGTHWVALYRKSSTSQLEYFDSFGSPIPESLQAAINWLCGDDKKIRIVQNTKRHQYDEFSCGPFSLYFIIQRASGIPFSWFLKNRITREEIADFRESVFDIDPAKTVRRRLKNKKLITSGH